MYAVIKTGGKQYKVSEGDVIKVEKLCGDVGSQIEIKDVLMIGAGEGAKIGSPVVANAKVVAEIVASGKAKKVIAFKKKRRKGFDKKIGHRQEFTSIKIKEITA
ncbi:MAG: 50S ribosomal protein L21 [Deltaproteobacteria bacterium GWC2_42_11]|nr:MAG: 50S ribosomal protein L21 [Deltaproteobacteria bacterium GWC2_42_11]HBO84392.1 50S ribosomal protein L21 [Deltaproteobacteria bacterium]